MELFNSLFFVNLYFAFKLVLSLLSIPFAIYIFLTFFKNFKVKRGVRRELFNNRKQKHIK